MLATASDPSWAVENDIRPFAEGPRMLLERKRHFPTTRSASDAVAAQRIAKLGGFLSESITSIDTLLLMPVY